MLAGNGNCATTIPSADRCGSKVIIASGLQLADEGRGVVPRQNSVDLNLLQFWRGTMTDDAVASTLIATRPTADSE